jgi:hypothetical protein
LFLFFDAQHACRSNIVFESYPLTEGFLFTGSIFFSLATGGLEHIFVILAIVFVIAWVFIRFYYGRGRYIGGRRSIV